MLRFGMLVLATATAGCGLNQQAQMQAIGNAADEVRAKEIASCGAQYPAGVKGSAAANIRCTNAANLKFNQAIPGNGNLDLIEVANTQAVVAAEKFDAGKISKAEMEAEMALIASRTKQAFTDRGMQASNANAAQQQAAAARQQAAMNSIAAGAAIMTPPPPTNTSCSTFGNTVNCRHY